MTLIWVLYADGVGGRNQLEGLARHIGWPFVMKRLRFRRRSLGDRLARREPEVLEDQSDPIDGPWPDLMLVMSEETTLFALAFRKKLGRVIRIVKVGRTIPTATGVDLWIQTGQFLALPWRPTVRIGLPFHLVSREALMNAAAQFRESVMPLPRPRVALLIGGSTKKLDLSVTAAKRLAHEISAWIQKAGGSLLIVSSPRTGADVEMAVSQHIEVPSAAYYWSRPEGPNPYMAFLALSDRIVVTEDSVSMLAEACATGKPVDVFPLSHVHRTFLDMIPWSGISGRFGFGKRAQLSALIQKGDVRMFALDVAPKPIFANPDPAGDFDRCFPEDHRAAVSTVRLLVSAKGIEP